MNKSRTRSVILSERITNQMENPATYTVSGNSSVLTWTDVQTGTGVPAYADKIASLRDASSSYVRSDVVTLRPGYYNAQVVWKGDSSTVKNTRKESVRGNAYFSALPPTSVGSYASVDNFALSNFLKNANDVIAPLKGGVVVGEFKETLAMLRSPASSLRDSISTYLKRAYAMRRKIQSDRKGRLGRAGRRGLKEISNLYMEYTFGWMPLLGSIRQACDAYTALQAKTETARAYGKSSDRGERSESKTNKVYLGSLRLNFNQVRFTTYTSTYKGVVKVGLSALKLSEAERAAFLSGFRLGDFLPTLWELMPYSWALDYFANISGILNSPAALTSEWVWRSRAIQSRVSLEATASLDLAFAKSQLGSKLISTSFSAANGVLLRTAYERSYPQLWLPSLSLHLADSPWKWTNLLGLLTQRIRA